MIGLRFCYGDPKPFRHDSGLHEPYDVKEDSMISEPLLFGRVTRVLFGVVTFVLIWVIGVNTLTLIGTVALAILGVSFIIGGLTGNPGCEITAIPNLFRSKENRLHAR
jgi:hypothetical protein